MAIVSANCIFLNSNPYKDDFLSLENEALANPGSLKEKQSIIERFIHEINPDQPGAISLNNAVNTYKELLSQRIRGPNHPFVESVMVKNANIMNAYLRFLNEGFDVNCKGLNGKTAAHCGAMSGNIEVLEELFEKGLDLEVKDDFMNTPLHDAVIKNQKNVVKWLIEKNVEINEFNSGYYTPLKIAQQENLREISKLLKDAGSIDYLD